MANKKKRPQQNRPTAKKAASAKPPAANREGSKVKLSRHAAERRRKRRIANVLWSLLAISLVGAIIYWVASGPIKERQAISAMTTGSCRFDREVDPGDSSLHIPNPTYRVEPPAGGPHTREVASAGNYSTAAQLPPDGQQVHALEHGYINVYFKPDLPQADKDALVSFQQENRRDVLLLPRNTIATPVAATAWGERLLCDQVELAALERFTETFVNKGPEKVPHP